MTLQPRGRELYKSPRRSRLKTSQDLKPRNSAGTYVGRVLRLLRPKHVTCGIFSFAFFCFFFVVFETPNKSAARVKPDTHRRPVRSHPRIRDIILGMEIAPPSIQRQQIADLEKQGKAGRREGETGGARSTQNHEKQRFIPPPSLVFRHQKQGF